MSEMTTISKADLANLEERVERLASDKAYLQLTIQLMNKMSAVSGLANTIETMLKSVSDVIGGVNLILYYVIDGGVYYADVYGDTKKLDAVDDERVKKVMDTREPIEYAHEFSDGKLMTPESSKAYTWIAPLLVEAELIGVFKLESLPIAVRELSRQLPTFFNYAALVLKNEILGYTRLQKDDNDLAQEMSARKQVEAELHWANQALEDRVVARIAELQTANAQLEENEKQITALLDKSEQSRRALLNILEDERQLEMALRRERALLSRIMETSPVGITMVDRDGQITFANPQAERVLDLPKEEITQRAYNAPSWFITDYDGNPFPDEKLPFRQVMSTGKPVLDVQHTIIWSNGRHVFLSINGAPILDQAGKVESVVLTVADITERHRAEVEIKRLNRVYAVLSNINQMIVRTRDPQQLFEETCRIAVEDGEFRLAWIGQYDDQTQQIHVSAHHGHSDGFLEHVQRVRLSETPTRADPTATAIRENRCFLSNDIEREDGAALWRNEALTRGYRSCAILPLQVFDRVWGAVHLYAPVPGFFDDQEMSLLTEMAADLGYAVESLQRDEQRRQAEQALRESEEKYRTIIEQSAEGVTLNDEAGNIVEWNQANERMTGLKQSQVLGIPLWDMMMKIIAPDRATVQRREFLKSAVLEALQTGKSSLFAAPIEAEFYPPPSKEKHYLHQTIFPIKTEKGYRIATLTEDITERKRVEQELRETNELLRAIIEAAPTAIIGLDLEGRVHTVWNPAAEKMLGWSAQEAMGNFLPSVPVEKEDEFRRFRDLIRSGQTLNGIEVQRQKRDGTPIDYSIYASALHNPEGQITGNVAVLVDITERKRADNALRESEQKFRGFVESSSEGFTLVDEQGTIIEWNHAREKITGLPASQVLGKAYWDVQYQMLPREWQTPERHARNKQIVLDALQTGQSPIFAKVIEAEVMRQDGTRQFIQQTIFPIKTDKGYRIGSVTSNITERKRAEQERLAHLRFFECMDQINRAMQGTNDLEQMMRDVLDATLAIFDCDRAWLVYPCDPEATLWQVPMERTRPEYPSVLPLGVELPMDPAGATVFRILRGATGPVKFGPRSERPVPVEIAQGFSVQSFIAMAIYPKVGKPWVFGLHQCSYPRVWTAEEERLFQEIGRRLSDALSSLLMYRDLQESEAKFSTAFRSSPSALSVSSAQNRIYLDVNESFLQATGYTRAQVLGHTSAELNLWAVPEQAEQYRRLFQEHGSVHNFEYEFRRQTGEVGYALVSATLITLGGEICILAQSNDITERKRAEQEHLAHLRFLESMDQINRAIQGTNDLEEMMGNVLDVVLSIFDCDRAWLLYPCDPDAPSFRVPMEITKPEYPGAKFLNVDVPMSPGEAQNMREALESDTPVIYTAGTERPISTAKQFGVQSQMFVPVYPKVGKPWVFGLHQCSYPRVWTPEEERLFQEIGRRLTDGLTSLLAHRDLQDSEAKFSMAFRSSPTALSVSSAKSRIYLDVNESFLQATGYARAEVVGHTSAELNLWAEPEQRARYRQLLEEHGSVHNFECAFRRKNGEVGYAMVSATLITLGGETCILAQSSDITERKRAEEALRESEERFSTVFRLSPVAISIVRAADGRFVDVNDVFVKTSGYTREEIVGRTSDQLELWANPENHAAKIRELDEHNAVDTFEFKARTKSGEIKIGLAATAPIDLGGEKHFLSLIHDITDRKSAEETLRQQGAALEAAANGIVITDRQGVIRWVNPAFTRLTGFTAEESIGQNPRIWQSGKHDGAFFKNLWDTILAGQVWRGEIINRRKDGSLYTEEMTITPVRQVEGEITHFIAIKQNISERKQHEDEREAIIRISNALRTSPTRSEMLPVLLDQLNDLFHSDGATLAMQDPVTGEIVIELGRSIVGRNFTGARLAPGQGVSALVIASGKPYLNNDVRNDPRFVPLDQLGEAHAVACAPLITQDHTIGALWIVRQSSITENELRLLVAIADIAANAIHRTTLHEQTEQQLRRLTALHQIDNAISASLDLHIILNVLLNNSVALLGADAADILLYDPYTQTLSYAAGCGFRTRNIEYSQVRLGQGQAGTAALERRVIALPDMDQADSAFKLAALLADEGFVSHFCAPLIAKGQIKGVIEVFHRARLDPPAGWLDFLETLATQAAIAIDNATLFDHLQRSNLELKLAYDATIEGWSRALDLRDKETEGHTQRVAEMSVRLARSLGMRDEELIQVRRGALLHDIGKMGIPDRILLKGGSLTEQEWDIMRRHPTYAYELIAPIAFLRAALDIPYCHHEKWDGSGYPRGLKGEQIPLSARAFAVVDVWDALRSDRPYRHAWTKEQAYDYIREQAGIQFDPQVVEAFFALLVTLPG